MMRIQARATVLVLSAALMGCISASTSQGTGKAAAGIRGKDADGKMFELDDYKGKVVLLDFWAST